MAKPILPTLNDEPRGRDVSVAIKRLHTYMGEMEGSLAALGQRVAATPRSLSPEEMAAVLQTQGLIGPPPATAADLSGMSPTAPMSPVTPGSPPSPSVDHTAEVAAAKAELIAEAEDLSGDCGGFKITRRVASNLLAAGETTIGLLSKPGGTNCDGYSVDVVCYQNGLAFDCVVNAGTTNTPAWQVLGITDPARWRPPF